MTREGQKLPAYDPRRLRALREEHRHTPESISELIGTTHDAVLMYERGVLTPSPHTVAALAGVYAIALTDLYDPDDPDDAVTALDAKFARYTATLPPLAGDRRHRIRALLLEPLREAA